MVGSWLTRWPAPAKLSLLLAVDAVLLAMSLQGALYLHDRVHLLGSPAGVMLSLFGALVCLPLLLLSGHYRGMVRYEGMSIGRAAFAGLLLATTLSAISLLSVVRIPVGSLVVAGLVFAALTYLSRSLARELMAESRPGRSPNCRRALIYGAGACGRQLQALLKQRGEDLRAVGFLDDHRGLQGRLISGLPVISPGRHDLASYLERAGISEILLAIPSATPSQRRVILDRLAQLPVHVRTVPDLRELLADQGRIRKLREVPVEDLLGRDPIPPMPELLGRCLSGKSVLVTGAGGSIGAELCRQILLQRPSRLILLDQSEYALYKIDQELAALGQRERVVVETIAQLGSVLDECLLRQLFSRYGIETVYHAAAYKHVPLVEHNIIQGVQNNVLGTDRLAVLAGQHGVRHFVLISTDKAVRPTNVMGASKRFAELAVQVRAEEFPGTCYSMVRFGNVLASSGSVVPLFREQLAAGGPLTVTDPRITRYFMTIPEAVQLVIQAGAMAKGREVFVLDMGEPVRILDLARKMIQLAGSTVRDEGNPDGEIGIRFTGLRPGEKLYEELLIGQNRELTEHERIWRANEAAADPEGIREALGRLTRHLRDRDEVLVLAVLQRFVQGFQREPAPGVRTPLRTPVKPPLPVRRTVPREEIARELIVSGDTSGVAAAGSVTKDT